MTDDIREQLRQITAELAALPERRDELIRQALATRSAKVSELAADTGLSVYRIYQIRDGRR